MGVRLGLGFLGLFHLANGLTMLLWPAWWAAVVVHLNAPDHLHHHFITDIGLAFAASGIGMLLGARRGASRAAYAAAGAAWPLLHGLLHVEEWIAIGPPVAAGDRISEGVGVILAGIAGAVLAWLRLRDKRGDV
ncbi:MAG: hypothetical protein WDM91_03335 [Rhizomicrobium sp.]